MATTRAWIQIPFDLVDTLTQSVEDIHRSIAARPFDVLENLPAVAVSAEMVRAVHDSVTGAVYGTVRTANQLSGAIVGAIAEQMDARQPPNATPSAAVHLAESVLNGAIGDRLASQGNELAIEFSFVHERRPLTLEPEFVASAFPEASSKLAVFVHGLMSNEEVWKFYSQKHYRDDATCYGSRLREDLGHTPVYVRFNTGLRVSENAEAMAAALDDLVDSWPVEIDEITLIGHSMGGLVARGAYHHGRRASRPWVHHLKRIVCLGSPHLGSPLEKLADATGWLLQVFPETRAIAGLFHARSAGIKDLHSGPEFENSGSVDVPHYFLGSTLTEDPSHPIGQLIGDSLVRLPSALAGADTIGHDAADSVHVGGISHLELVNHPQVYSQIRKWMTEG